jgi:glutamate-5-semialdehyde dehydrogenase
MAAPLKTVEGTHDFAGPLRELGRGARGAARILALAPTEQKDAALGAMADALRAQKSEVLAANTKDLAEPNHPARARPFSIASRSTTSASAR